MFQLTISVNDKPATVREVATEAEIRQILRDEYGVQLRHINGNRVNSWGVSAEWTEVPTAPASVPDERTTKYVTATLTATFHGDYVDADEVAGRLDFWMDSGFGDRDDLRAWNLDVTSVREVTGDPERYDD